MTTIKEARLNAGLKQEELAMKSGVKLSTLQKLERGASSVNVHEWMKVIYGLALSIGLGFVMGWIL